MGLIACYYRAAEWEHTEVMRATLVHQVRGHELSLPKIGTRSAPSRPRSRAKADNWRRRQQAALATGRLELNRNQYGAR